MTTPALLSCHDSGREAASYGMTLGEATRAFQLGFRCGRQRPLEIGVRYIPAGQSMARRRPSVLARRCAVLRRLFSGVAGILLHDRKAW